MTAEEKREKKRKSKKSKEAELNGLPHIKKPLSAYILYNNFRRPALRATFPGKIHFSTVDL